MQPAPQSMPLTNPAIPPAATSTAVPKPQPGAMGFGGQLARALAVNATPGQRSMAAMQATGLQQQSAAVMKPPVDAPGQSTATTAQSVALATTPVGVPVQSPPDATTQSTAPEQTTPTAVRAALGLPLPAQAQAAQQPPQKPGATTERPRTTQGTRRDPASTINTDVSTPPVAVLPTMPAGQPLQQLPSAHLELPTPQQPSQPQHGSAVGGIEAATAKSAQPVAHAPDAQQPVADTPTTPGQATGAATSQLDTQKPIAIQSAGPSIVEPAATAQPPAAAPAPVTPPASGSPVVTQAAAPAAQVAPALVALGRAPDGAQRITMRLEPPELGQVQIRIDRPTDAPARVDITVERSETLTLLLRDQPQLQRALDQAGVPADGRTLTFHVATPEPAQRADGTPISPSSGGASTGLAGEFSHGTARQGGSGGGNPAQQAAGNDDGAEADSAPAPMMSWLRAGIDITA